MMNSTKLLNGHLYMYMYLILITFQVQHHWSCLVGLSIIYYCYQVCMIRWFFVGEDGQKADDIYCAIIFLPSLAFWFIQFKVSYLPIFCLWMNNELFHHFLEFCSHAKTVRHAIAWKKSFGLCVGGNIYHCIDSTLYQMYIATFFQINGQHQLVHDQ